MKNTQLNPATETVMNAPAERDREQLLTMLDRALRAEARREAPPEAEHGDWLYGSLDHGEPDARGWIAPPPPEHWIPKALCFWHDAVRMDAVIAPGLADHPRHALARWPAIDQAVRAYRPAIVVPD